MYLQSYKELTVWQKSMTLVEEIYALIRQLPREEIYSLGNQMRRAAISIPSNIAEGQRRKDLPEFLQFLRVADASSAELETQLQITKRLYSELDCSKAEKLLEEVQKMLSVMMKRLDLKAQSSKLKASSSKLKAFTLIELLVAISTFLIITAIATGSFVRALRTQRAATGFMAINDNAGLTLEQMAREIRAGSDFSTNPPDSNQLNFNNACGAIVTYSLISEAINRSVTASACGAATSGLITAANVKIKKMKFNLMGQNPGDGMPPRITISMSVGSDYRDLENVRTNIQTTVSARNIDT